MKILISFDLDQKYVERIRSVSEASVKTSSDPQVLLSEIQDAEILLAGRFNREMFAAARKLRWVQSVAAGVDRFLFDAFVASDVVLTNARGIHPPQVSDHTLALILAFSRRLNKFARAQLERKWLRLECDELQGRVIGVIGLGAIGREIARKAKCFGMKVLALDKNLAVPPSSVDELLKPTDLLTLLKQSDFVVLSVPLTKETEGLIGQRELAAMKKDGILINVSRGRIVQEQALVNALKERRIGGAGLDVFEEEPLPPESELWTMENVIITPHVAGSTPYYWSRVCDIFCENLRRYTSGQPLINVVDKKAGY
jgi:D-2-hydroxyacid dehydrogenase (NADP+)